MSDRIVYDTVRYGLITLAAVMMMIGIGIIRSPEWDECRAADPSIPGFYSCMSEVGQKLPER